MAISWPSSASTTTSGTSGWICTSTSGAVTNYTQPTWSVKWAVDSCMEDWHDARGVPAKLKAGKRTIELPDGAKLHIDDAGNYRIEDQAAKVTYKANRVREFSPHLNASDMVGRFVEYVASLGVKQGEVMGLPIQLFINWLIIEAAARDSDPVPPEVVPVEKHPRLKLVLKPKCLCCGRFIKRAAYASRFQFCSVEHAAQFMEKRAPAIGFATSPHSQALST